MNLADRIEEFVTKAAFEDIPCSPCLQGARRLDVSVIGREDNYPGFRVPSAHDPDRRFAVLPGHLHVEKHDVGSQQVVALDRLDAVRGFANDLDAVLRCQKSDDALPQHGVIVDDQNPYCSHETPPIYRTSHGATPQMVTGGIAA